MSFMNHYRPEAGREDGERQIDVPGEPLARVGPFRLQPQPRAVELVVLQHLARLHVG